MRAAIWCSSRKRWSRLYRSLMAHRPGGWKVAGLGGWLPRPGWPPQYEMITQLED